MMLICTIYKSLKKEGMYLYMEKSQPLEKVPESLLTVFGKPEFVMTLALTPERKLARVDRDEVVQAVKNQGFFLQMPPGKQDQADSLYLKNSK